MLQVYIFALLGDDFFSFFNKTCKCKKVTKHMFLTLFNHGFFLPSFIILAGFLTILENVKPLGSAWLLKMRILPFHLSASSLSLRNPNSFGPRGNLKWKFSVYVI